MSYWNGGQNDIGGGTGSTATNTTAQDLATVAANGGKSSGAAGAAGSETVAAPEQATYGYINDQGQIAQNSNPVTVNAFGDVTDSVTGATLAYGSGSPNASAAVNATNQVAGSGNGIAPTAAGLFGISETTLAILVAVAVAAVVLIVVVRRRK